MIFFMLRRTTTILLCAGSFWLGIKADRLFTANPAAAPVAADCGETTDGN